MRNVYLMLMIGFGAGLITLGFIGIALSGHIEIQRRQDWVLVGQRAGASVSSFALNISGGDYYLGVFVWVHDSAEAFYSISDASGNQIVILCLEDTDQVSEWKYSEMYFHITDSGYYTFELLNATFSNIRSNARLYQSEYVDESSFPYQSLLLVGVFSLVAGVPLAIVGLADSHVQDSKVPYQN